MPSHVYEARALAEIRDEVTGSTFLAKDAFHTDSAIPYEDDPLFVIPDTYHLLAADGQARDVPSLETLQPDDTIQRLSWISGLNDHLLSVAYDDVELISVLRKS